MRWAHVSMTVRTRSTGRSLNDDSWSLVKHTTSQRPTAGRVPKMPLGSGASAPTEVTAYDGKRFSKTTTW